jgi:hypothetical protein
MTVTALTDKVKFVNTGKTQYKIETLLGGKRSGWSQTKATMPEVMDYIKRNRHGESDTTFLVTEVTTRTLGIF